MRMLCSHGQSNKRTSMINAHMPMCMCTCSGWSHDEAKGAAPGVLRPSLHACKHGPPSRGKLRRPGAFSYFNQNHSNLISNYSNLAGTCMCLRARNLWPEVHSGTTALWPGLMDLHVAAPVQPHILALICAAGTAQQKHFLLLCPNCL